MVHHRQVAREIKDEYVDTISKVYFSYFKAYISKLTKLQVSLTVPQNDRRIRKILEQATPGWTLLDSTT